MNKQPKPQPSAEDIKNKNKIDYLSDLHKGYCKWKAKGEDGYATAFLAMINLFTEEENPQKNKE